MTRLLLLLAAILPAAGCLPEYNPPASDFGSLPSCGNGTCDPAESCVSCKADCDCCGVAYVAGTASSGALTDSDRTALLTADGKSVALGPASSLELTLWSEWRDILGKADFKIHGTVSSSTAPDLGQCPAGILEGAFQVDVREENGSYRRVGFWTAGSTEFDISCVTLTHAKAIRISGLAGAVGQLDAITANAGACLLVTP